MMSVEIRKASTLDTTRLVGLAAALMDEIGDAPASQAQVSMLFSEIEVSESDEVLVAKDAGKLVGMLLVHYRRAMSHGSWVAEVDDMYVLPEYRCQGIGTMLLEQAARVARQRRARVLVAGVGARNEKALGFYRDHGFVETGRVLSRPLED